MDRKFLKKLISNNIIIAGIFIFSGIFLNAGCSTPGLKIDSFPDDRRNIPKPGSNKINGHAEAFDKQSTYQIGQMFDLSRQFRKLFGASKEAVNIDSFDNLPNSSWYTNRNAYHKMTTDEIKRGPDTGSGPNTNGDWTIFKAKTSGVTPGFHIIDNRGGRYVIKFDPPRYPELATGAEVIATKLFYAAGYNVPENFIVFFDASILKAGDDVWFADAKGRKRLLVQSDVEAITSKLRKGKDGKLRVLASKYLPGKPLGPFNYTGTRKDDPNDIIPHEHRRELRGLRVIAAWLHHFDTKAGNSLDSYVSDGSVSYVKHFLIDFGSTLGSGAVGPAMEYLGYENFFDPHAITKNLLLLGMNVRPYEKLENTPSVSVGHFDAESFSPQKYKFIVPNPAFENMTERDGYWAAKVVMSFTNAQLEAAVSEARFTEAAAAAYLVNNLKSRRDIIGRYWTKRINPLEDFRLTETASGNRIIFDDLAVENGYESPSASAYRYCIKRDGKILSSGKIDGEQGAIDINRSDAVYGKINNKEDFELLIRTKRRTGKKWSGYAKVYWGFDEKIGSYKLIGLTHDD